ncbi:Phospholipid/glycerol acyltransferase [Gammaproteobacteria bacterium]
MLRSLLARWHATLALSYGLGLLGGLSLSWSLLASPLRFVLPAAFGQWLGRWVISFGFRFYFRALSGIGACHFDLGVLDDLRDAGPLVIAPNHPCLLDALMVLSRLPNLVCILKASILDNLFLGGGARLAGYIRNDTPLRMIRTAVKELQKGGQVLIFPEGTRTTRWPVDPCLASIGYIAQRARVPVQTVLIETDSAYLTKGWPLWRQPALPIRYRLRLGQRFESPPDPEAFAQELEHYFLSVLPPGPPGSPRPCPPLFVPSS